MKRLAILTLLALSLATPAHAKPRPDLHSRTIAVYRGILPRTPAELTARGFTRIKTVGKGPRIAIAVSEYWRTRGEDTRFGTRYPTHALVIVTRSQPPKPKALTYYTHGSGVERWRPHVRYWLKEYGCWSAKAEDFILHIFASESSGDPKCRHGQHAGIAQMNDDWGSLAQRLDAAWAIRRTVKAYAEGGYANLENQWCEHHVCRWSWK